MELEKNQISPENPSWLAEDGTIRHEYAPEEIRPVLEAKHWKNVPDIVKSYRELESFVGKKIFNTLPEMELTEELKGKIYEKLGVPSKPEEYSLPKDYTPPVPIDEKLLRSFQKYAWNLRMTPEQFQEIVKFQLDAAAQMEQQAKEEYEAAKKKAVEELKSLWKDKYETNFKAAKRAAEELGILQDLEETGLADNPKIIQMLHTIWKKLSEADISGKANAPVQKIDAKAELESLLKSEALMNRTHPDHKEVFRRYLELASRL